jgi:hypothetical protein
MNEFLSALAMMLLLHTYVPEETLIAVATCIEASIPPFEDPIQRVNPWGKYWKKDLRK